MLKSKPFKGLAFILQSLAATLHHQLLQAMQNHSSYHLFVYGSLRQGFHHPAYQYISKYFNLVGHATTAGVLYDLGEYPAAKSSNLQSDVLHGELYAIKNVAELDWALAQLDDYEGLNPEDGPALFCRQLCTVSVLGSNATAWVYWYNLDVASAPIVSSGDVLVYFQQKSKA